MGFMVGFLFLICEMKGFYRAFKPFEKASKQLFRIQVGLYQVQLYYTYPFRKSQPAALIPIAVYDSFRNGGQARCGFAGYWALIGFIAFSDG